MGDGGQTTWWWMGSSAGEHVQITDRTERDARHCQGTLTGPAIPSFALPPHLGGRGIVVDGPHQRRPFQPLGRAVIAAVTQPKAEVAPLPFRPGPTRPRPRLAGP